MAQALQVRIVISFKINLLLPAQWLGAYDSGTQSARQLAAIHGGQGADLLQSSTSRATVFGRLLTIAEIVVITDGDPTVLQINQPFRFVLQVAAWQTAKVGCERLSKTVVPKLMSFLESRDSEVRSAAAATLANIVADRSNAVEILDCALRRALGRERTTKAKERIRTSLVFEKGFPSRSTRRET